MMAFRNLASKIQEKFKIDTLQKKDNTFSNYFKGLFMNDSIFK